ncbi:MAG: hypothetical protein C1O27_002368 [Chloroflexi bacterium]|jgi:hypothetical protein|nr:MAG: hypothetical protein C1O27_002368 [Chloroflexota bacterium]
MRSETLQALMILFLIPSLFLTYFLQIKELLYLGIGLHIGGALWWLGSRRGKKPDAELDRQDNRLDDARPKRRERKGRRSRD